MRFTLPAAVFLLIQNENKEILLARRYNTGHEDGNYGLPSGHIDGDETLVTAACREAMEELSVAIEPQHLRFIHVQHNRELSVPSNTEYLNFYFLVQLYDGIPKIMEPEKCDDLHWCKPDQLPNNTIDYIRQFIEDWQASRLFRENGW